MNPLLTIQIATLAIQLVTLAFQLRRAFPTGHVCKTDPATDYEQAPITPPVEEPLPSIMLRLGGGGDTITIRVAEEDYGYQLWVGRIGIHDATDWALGSLGTRAAAQLNFDSLVRDWKSIGYVEVTDAA